MLVADHDVGVASVPLNVTVLVPLVAPKLVPVIVTEVPTGPLVGERLVSVGATVTVYGSALLARPLTVTTTLPVPEPAGTGTTMLVADHDVGVAAVPLNVTALVPCVAAKFVPATVTTVPTGPLAGDRLVSVGATVTVYGSALLAKALTVTITLPVVAPAGTGTTMLVADHDVGVASVPLNVTVLVPCEAPKLVPTIVTMVPTGPLLGDRFVSVGATVTVYGSALLARPLTVTTTLPVVAPAGTGTTRLVADHDVGVAAVPLNVTVLVPCDPPKLVPAIVTTVPTGPLLGDRFVSVGATVTVYGSALLARPLTVTTTLPVVAPAGTGTLMLVADHAVGVAVVPLNETVLVPCEAPKFVPVIVTAVPTGPLLGERVVSVGATVTVYGSALLARPLTVTTTLPVVAPAGTGTTRLVDDHDVGVARVPLNVTVLVPCEPPKLAPVIVTTVPTGPLVGDRLVSVGATVTVYGSALLARPLTVTITLPVVAPTGTGTTTLVADHDVGVAGVPLNVTVLVPCEAPKLVPAIVTMVPTGPLLGDRFVSVGATVTVYGSALLARPLTVTTTLPVVAPAGTGTTRLVADHDVGVARVPLNVTVLAPCEAPKFVPVIVTAVPTGPLLGERVVSVGATVTVYGSALLARPLTVTTTLPVVAPAGTGTTRLDADHDVGVAGVPLNVTVLVPCEAPKLVPAIVTMVPTGPDAGVSVVMLGDDTVTVNGRLLLA